MPRERIPPSKVERGPSNEIVCSIGDHITTNILLSILILVDSMLTLVLLKPGYNPWAHIFPYME